MSETQQQQQQQQEEKKKVVTFSFPNLPKWDERFELELEPSEHMVVRALYDMRELLWWRSTRRSC